jgi:hypothetical protein
MLQEGKLHREPGGDPKRQRVKLIGQSVSHNVRQEKENELRDVENKSDIMTDKTETVGLELIAELRREIERRDAEISTILENQRELARGLLRLQEQLVEITQSALARPTLQMPVAPASAPQEAESRSRPARWPFGWLGRRH